jgi:hypothetical protein
MKSPAWSTLWFVSLALLAISGCAIFDDTEEVEQDNRQSLTACDFLGIETGVCARGIPTPEGDCLPPIAYERIEASCDGIDNDCNGDADRACPCDYQGLDAGVCAGGVIAPDGTCGTPDAFEEEETSCDDADNDCDGVVDEGCECNFRQVSLGVCASAIGDDGACAVPDDFEGTERSCDNLDNDCDGDVDEEVSGPCALTDGVCAQAVATCVDGDFAECTAEDYGPNYETEESTCDGLDNDCDGVVDEGCPCSFGGSVDGVCADATIAQSGDCTPPSGFENDETACDGADNDCDGTADEGCTCTPGESRPCGTNTGTCQTGTQACGTDATWGDCVDAVGPQNEVCDGRDNDCDGTSDEQLRVACAQQAGVCAGATVACNPDDPAEDGLYSCTREELVDHSTRYEPDETACDGVDNDCDGVVDERCPCEWNGSVVGVCGTATINSDGDCAEPPAYAPTEDSCDSMDNDCDGITDEECPCDYLGSPDGVCANGRVSSDTGSCLKPAHYSANDASCDDRDNDCDGEVDDDAPASESNCADGTDDDCDGYIDCADPDCEGKVCDAVAEEEPQQMTSALSEDEESAPPDTKTCQAGACK